MKKRERERDEHKGWKEEEGNGKGREIQIEWEEAESGGKAGEREIEEGRKRGKFFYNAYVYIDKHIRLLSILLVHTEGK